MKISNYNLKRNARTNESEIYINKRTKLYDPDANEVHFDIYASPQPQLVPVTNIMDILPSDKTKYPVSVVGKVNYHGPVETIMTKGKFLQKQEATITDDTTSVRLVLWEKDINKVTDDSSYKLQKVMVRVDSDKKYLTLNTSSIISQIDQSFDSEHDAAIVSNYKTVKSPANGVTTVQ